ncbi:alpha/beta hydrolase [Robertmurraya massiliosenegalensis]|uniref:alpha/beta hydrolase n=1 Tax=Robertmurraya massiliosenegalensis TaxID=1287657 RepID=UPI0002F757D1|nr:alpha/beta hydrolase [Robertmurraya massiliosenegalensis]
MKKNLSLEKAAQNFIEATANPPYLFDLGPVEGRKVVDSVQSGEIDKPHTLISDMTIHSDISKQIKVRIVRPDNSDTKLPVILYIHGAGWVFGNSHTHDRLTRKLAVETNAIVVFPEYSLSPEAKYPIAIEEIYEVLKWVEAEADQQQFDIDHLFVAGDSVGGNMAAAITLMTKERKGPKISKQLLFYPVTDADFDTESYHQFETGYFLRRDGMQWFWDQYTTDPTDRAQITASPLRASKEQLTGLPQALVITAEADVLRDEGEAYANKLREAGVPVTAVRFQGIIHDFVMLNEFAETEAAKGALLLATSWLRS